MELHIAKWGNSLALRLPARLARELGVAEGATVTAEVGADGELRLRPLDAQPAGRQSRAQLAQDIRQMHRDWPAGSPVVRWMRDQD